MNVPCPKCKKPTPIPTSLRKTGVARTTCPQCKFAFVIRIGEPKKSDQPDGPPPPLVLKSIEGVKASAEMEQTAGEIGEAGASFVAADTRTSIVIDDTLKKEINKIEEEEQAVLAEVETVAGDSEADGGIASAATVIDPAQDAAKISTMPTEVGDESDGLPDSETEPDAIPEEQPAGVEAPASAVQGVEASASEVSAETAPEVPGVEAPASEEPPVQAPASEPSVEAPASETPVEEPTEAPAIESPASSDPSSGASSPSTEGPRASEAKPVARPIIQPPVKTHAPVEEIIPSYGPPRSGGVRVLGGFITVCLIIFGILSLYVLSQNSWSLDMNDIGGMLSRAFGLSDKPSRFDGLDVSQPIVRSIQIKDRRALVLEGVINNKGPSLWRFIYLRAKLQRHGKTVVKKDVPAGNVIDVDAIRKMSPSQWEARLNPAGIDGRNSKIEAGETIAYQFLISEPADYSSERYRTLVEVLKAETNDSQ